MLEPLYYRLSEAERLLSVSRDTLLRFERAGLLVMHGKNHGKRVTGASLRALALRIEQGEDLWHAVQQSESPAPSAPKRMARGRSTRTRPGDGGISHQPKTASDSLASEPIPSKQPAWLKKIT
jgi:hypothetical protein